jgi:hypothetical protein
MLSHREIFEQSEKTRSEESLKELVEKGRLWIEELSEKDYK